MSLSFQVMPRSDEAERTAIETRQYLDDLLVRIQPLLEQPALAELSKEDIRGYRTAGGARFTAFSTDTVGHKVNSLIQFMQFEAASTRAGSYEFEGVVKAFHAALHRDGQKLDEEARALIAVSMFRDYCGGYAYIFCTERGVEGFGAAYDPWMQCLDEWQIASYIDGSYGIRSDATYAMRREVQAYLDTQPVTPRWGEPGPVSLTTVRPLVLCYTDVDGPWVAGFLTAQDLCRARFSRVRLGAWLALLGMPDEKVKQIVEKAKVGASNAQFELHPNDIAFGELYERGRQNVGSCMANLRDQYSTWDDIHPTDAYSSSYFGSGDNGLCLVTQVIDGNIVGRGILSAKTGRIVRWYGSVQGQRALDRVGIRISGYALKGSWLTLLDSGKRFIGPYIDGDIEYGRVDKASGRVYIEHNGVHLSETSGVYGQDEVYCSDDDDYHERDECTYQTAIRS